MENTMLLPMIRFTSLILPTSLRLLSMLHVAFGTSFHSRPLHACVCQPVRFLVELLVERQSVVGEWLVQDEAGTRAILKGSCMYMLDQFVQKSSA